MPWDLDENLPIYLQLTDDLEKKVLRDMRELGIEKKEVCTMIDALKEEEA